MNLRPWIRALSLAVAGSLAVVSTAAANGNAPTPQAGTASAAAESAAGIIRVTDSTQSTPAGHIAAAEPRDAAAGIIRVTDAAATTSPPIYPQYAPAYYPGQPVGIVYQDQADEAVPQPMPMPTDEHAGSAANCPHCPSGTVCPGHVYSGDGYVSESDGQFMRLCTINDVCYFLSGACQSDNPFPRLLCDSTQPCRDWVNGQSAMYRARNKATQDALFAALFGWGPEHEGVPGTARCTWGYFHHTGCGGQGCPLAGHYSMVYAANPEYFDPRDSELYAAPGFGVPITVPLAPNVEHTYNFGWGTPSSRLTPISNLPQYHSP